MDFEWLCEQKILDERDGDPPLHHVPRAFIAYELANKCAQAMALQSLYLLLATPLMALLVREHTVGWTLLCTQIVFVAGGVRLWALHEQWKIFKAISKET